MPSTLRSLLSRFWPALWSSRWFAPLAALFLCGLLLSVDRGYDEESNAIAPLLAKQEGQQALASGTDPLRFRPSPRKNSQSNDDSEQFNAECGGCYSDYDLLGLTLAAAWQPLPAAQQFSSTSPYRLPSPRAPPRS